MEQNQKKPIKKPTGVTPTNWEIYKLIQVYNTPIVSVSFVYNLSGKAINAILESVEAKIEACESTRANLVDAQQMSSFWVSGNTKLEFMEVCAKNQLIYSDAMRESVNMFIDHYQK